MKWAEDKIVNNNLTLVEVIDRILDEVKEKGLLQMSGMKGGSGSLALPRKQEIMQHLIDIENLK